MRPLIGLCLAACVCATAPAQNRAPATAPSGQATAASSINFNAVAFKDAIDYLADLSGANMVVNWKELERASITPNTPVSMRLGGVTMRKALDLLLRQVGGETPLTYTVEEGVIEITTQTAADEKLVTRTYGIQDLLFEAQDFTNAPQMSLQSSSSSGGTGRGGRGTGGGGGGGTTGLFGGTGTNANAPGNTTSLSQKERAEEIIRMITTTIRPEIWQENGGRSKISFYRGKLIVTAPMSVHRLIG